VFRYRTGTAGSAAGATAAANYFLSETLKPENELLAKYYAGETVPELTTGMDSLGRAIADGDIELEAATEELVRAHERLFGSPYDLQGLEERISGTLLKAAIRSEMRDELAAQGGSVARVREDLDPRLAKCLGIDTMRPLTQGELAHLLAGARTDGGAIEGKQIQQPMKSVSEVFGLTAAALPEADAAWFKIGDFWVTRTRRKGRVLKPDFDRRVVVCGRPAGLPGSRLLGLKRAEAQQRQPVRMAFVGQ
jgi:hypothetical protein